MDRFAQLQAFVEVVEAGSFSRAADRLGIGKSLVSRRVSELEKNLGAQLLQRTTRSLSLTSHGRAFFERAIRILGDLEEAEQAIADDAGALRGKLRLAAPLSFGLHHLGRAINGFLADHPGIELDLDLNDRQIDLVEEGFDMAIRIGDLPDSTLIARRLGAARFATCASPGYLAEHGEPKTPDELSGHVGLHYSNATLAEAWRFGGTDKEPITAIPGIRLRASNGDALAAAAMAGLGIVNLPTFIVADALRAGDLIAILQDYRRAPLGIHALYPPGRLMPRRLRLFSDYLEGRFGDSPYWDDGLFHN
jgi:DNA-binding transcriptional LysR family regulator